MSTIQKQQINKQEWIRAGSFIHGNIMAYIDCSHAVPVSTVVQLSQINRQEYFLLFRLHFYTLYCEYHRMIEFHGLVRPKVCRCHDERLFYLDHLILHLELHCSSFAMWGAAVLVEWLCPGQYFSYSTKYCSFKAVSDIISTFIEKNIFFGQVLSGLSLSKLGQSQSVRFIIVIIFLSYSHRFSVVFIR